MRDIIRFFRQTYRAVHTDVDHADAERAPPSTETEPTSATAGSLTHSQASERFRRNSTVRQSGRRPLNKGFSILDVFFSQPKRGRGPRWPKGVFLLKASGLLAIISAIVLYVLQPYDAIFRWKLVFAENGEIFNLWQNPPVEVYIKIFVFNITNAEAYMRGDDPKMRVSQVGPYTYRERMLHDNIAFNGNGTVSTSPKHPLTWDEKLSLGNREEDMVYVPNIAMLSIAQVTSGRSFFIRTPINMLIRQTRSEPLVRMTAKEFMFGYASTLTTLGNQLMPDWIHFEKVGLIDRMYDFDGDTETVFTGESDSSISGLIDTYRGSPHLSHWSEPHCSNIHMASDGTKFKSFIEPNETLLFYRKNMCRPQRLNRIGDDTIKIGQLEAYRYEFEANAMDNGVHDERNKCFCRTPDTCLPAGLLDVSDCYYGFPIALSYPHFLDGDEKLREDVLGTQPNRSEHTTFMMVQPLSGMPLQVSVKIQINLAMRDVSNMAHLERFSNVVIPMVWFEITMPDLPPALKTRFNLYLNIMPVVDLLCQLFLFTSGCTLVLVAIVRASMLFSRTMQISGSQQQQQQQTLQRYASLGRGGSSRQRRDEAGQSLTGSRRHGYGNDDVDAEEDDDDDDSCAAFGDRLSYEMSEKCIRNGDDVVLYEVDLCTTADEKRRRVAADDETAYMLEQEHAISEDEEEEEEADSDGSSANGQRSMSYEDNATVVDLPNLCNENGSYVRDDDVLIRMHNPTSTASAAAMDDNCRLGTFTSSLEDIATDAFPDVVLRIDEDNGGLRGDLNDDVDDDGGSADSSTGSASMLVT